MDTIRPVQAHSIISPKRGMEGSLQLQTPRPPKACGSPGPGKPCWDVDLRVTVLLVAVAGAVILLLLYKLLQMRHRLRVARAGQALRYYSFYHAATYTLRDPQVAPAKNGNISEVNPVVQIVTTATPPTNHPPPPPPSASPPHPPPLPSPPVPPPPPLIPPPPLPPTPPLLTLPLPLPVIHNTPPSPHLSWGASSDVEVYSRIGAFRPSRLSSLSSQTQVILFEHSSL
ncbi:amyloid beta A4 precursor protein-binding family B member 1-interacting protein [Lampris incognitus]|uniref:amyloid beta A4 precursor protein-binding family B member 1-interacting protein n=1 Tax=Lampris incognitus TaxID=2546036 RepID=UPI0024B52E32|nr:amyloid beta A4 precursor protein-binding family B member 1-interacting protein [Lampris incognitus]